MAILSPPYCGTGDLLVEDSLQLLPSNLDTQKYVDAAANEMDSKLGFTYKLPLESDDNYLDSDGNPIADFPQHEKDLLRDINAKLASGRILMQTQVSADGASYHPYAKELIAEAQALLIMIANRDVLLSGLLKGDPERLSDRGPTIVNHDSHSMVEQFEENFMRGRSHIPPFTTEYIRPGSD